VVDDRKVHMKSEDNTERYINKDFLLTLMKADDGSQVMIQEVDILNPYLNILSALERVCDKLECSLKDLIDFLRTTEELKLLDGTYKYCISLDAKSNLLDFNHLKTIDEVIDYHSITQFNIKGALSTLKAKNLSKAAFERSQKQIEESYQDKVRDFKFEIYRRYKIISQAFSINISYRKCHENKKTLTFSHRIRGWSSPAYQLTLNFSIELKTNFGFGNSSYFYVKIKYKNIDICPISEWINYEIAHFSEIIRYTKSYTKRLAKENFRGQLIYTTVIGNNFWIDALAFAQNACNISINDEAKFVEDYIVKECELMVKGLENIMHATSFTFQKDRNPPYSKDKSGHELIDFRGEKITGALDFITKILEFKAIIIVENLICRIERLNKLMQPILIAELKVVDEDLIGFKLEIDKLAPEFNEFQQRHRNYIYEKQYIKNAIVIKRKIRDYEVDPDEIEQIFNMNFPEFDEFDVSYKKIVKNYNALRERIVILNTISKNINTYNIKIDKYFRN
jgi:hypothetical protein